MPGCLMTADGNGTQVQYSLQSRFSSSVMHLMESPLLEVFTNHLGEALSDMV